MTQATPEPGAHRTPALAPEDLEALDDLLDELRTRLDETPQWEFCDGFLTALVCSRRAIPPAEYLSMLLGDGENIEVPDGETLPLLPMFSGAEQQARFLALWQRRWDEVTLALDTPVEALDDPRTLEPEVMDVRGALLALPEADRPPLDDEEIPSFAQVWALGFMFAVENWPEDWAPPREREHAQWLDDALDSIVALTEDDTAQARAFWRGHLGGVRPAPALEKPGSARGDGAQGARTGTQRSVLVRQRQEVQEVPRRLICY